MIPNCAATRHAHFVLDGSGPAEFEAPKLSDWPDGHLDAGRELASSVDLDTLTQGRSRVLEAGPAPAALRQAAHRPRRRAQAHPGHAGERREPLPVDFTNRVIYYVGPVDPVRDEVVGPAGPTTVHAHGQVHRHDARQDRPDRDGRQGRARPGGDRGDPQAQGGLPDGGRRRRLPGLQGDPQVARARASRTSAWRRSTSSR